jgi:hypothetical protein
MINDDLVQGHHFDTHVRPHRHQLPYVVIEKLLCEMEAKIGRVHTLKRAHELAREMRDLALYQFFVRGLDWTQHQVLAVYQELLEPNIDFFSDVLRRAQKAGLVFRGVSEFTGVIADSTDIGAINVGGENHFAKTMQGNLTEGFLYVEHLKALLRSLPEWRGKEEVLERLIRAPLYGGDKVVGWGTVRAPGGYEWGIDFRATPPGRVDWRDPLKKSAKNWLSRGNVPRMLEGKVTLHAVGDKHFYCAKREPWGVRVMGPPGTETDSFAEIAGGLPPNSTGVLFVCLPADGPDSGPILFRPLLIDHLRRFFEEGEKLDWGAFLPNPV